MRENGAHPAQPPLTAHRLDQILDGDLEEFTEAIQAEDRRLSLEAAGS